MYLFDFFRLVPKTRKIKISNKKGIIFSNPPGIKRYIFYISNIIFLAGLIMALFIYIPIGKAWLVYRSRTEDIQMKLNNQDIKPVVDKENSVFRIEIPKILAEAKVVENVDVTDKKTFNKILINNNVALSTGSGRPGDGNGSLLYIFAHSTTQSILGARQNSVFYLLGELKTNDEINIFYNSQKFTYKVYDKMVVSSNDISYLGYKKENKEVLILQTCWPLGTNWKRLLVLAEKI